MSGIPIELLLVLLFGAFMVFNMVVQHAARKRQALAPPPAPEEQDEFEQAEFEPDPAVIVPPPAVATKTAVVPVARVWKPRRRYSKQSLFGSRRAAQDAFVVATILGPCRADQPHEPL